MSINMTQALTFETDELKSFALMLECAAKVLFDSKKFKPVVLLKEPSFWEDGKYEGYDFHTSQPMMLPLAESDNLLVKPCATYHGATKLEVVNKFADLDEAARESCKQRIEPVPKRKWICTIEEYFESRSLKRGDYVRPKKDELVEVVLELCRNQDTEGFRHDFADIEDAYFDGSVGVGYRMQWRPNGGWDVLDISMVHAYYGK